MAFYGKLYPGNMTSPVAYARRHANNRITQADKISKLKFWKSVKIYFKGQNISLMNKLLIDKKLANLESKTRTEFIKSFIKNAFQ